MATTGVRGGDIAWPVLSVLGVIAFALVLGRPLARLVVALGDLAHQPTGETDEAGGRAAANPVDLAAGAGSPRASEAGPAPSAGVASPVGPASPVEPTPTAGAAGLVKTGSGTASASGSPYGVAVAVLFIFAAAAGTHALRLEAILGAFVAGILLGSTPTIDLRRLEPLRLVVVGVLAPIFFASAGLRIDLTALAEAEVAIAGVVILALAIFGKFAGAYIGARISRLGHWEALSLGAGLNARGVIEIVVAGTGLRLGVLSPAMYTVIVLVAIATSIMTPPILRATMRRVEQTAEEQLRELDLADRRSFAPGGV
nr:cation:proton antiporter [Parafrankia elaeagni]